MSTADIPPRDGYDPERAEAFWAGVDARRATDAIPRDAAACCFCGDGVPGDAALARHEEMCEPRLLAERRARWAVSAAREALGRDGVNPIALATLASAVLAHRF